MENANTAKSTLSNATVEQDAAQTYLTSITCSIRRKPNTVGLPGQDPNERRYRIGASLDTRSNGNKKGVTDKLELLFMPSILGVSHNDPTFRRVVDEYWSGISRFIPADEPFLKDHEKGEVLKITFDVVGKIRKEKIANLGSIEEKVDYLNTLLVTTIKDTTLPLAVLREECISDFLLLNYCLKYNKVANRAEDMDNSPRIDFYLFEKSVAIRNQLSLIDLRSKAMKLYESLQSDVRKVKAVLLMFKDSPDNYETDEDMLLAIDSHYNASLQSLNNFVSFVEDDSWEIKYIINNALKTNKLKSPKGSSAIYYNDVLLGMSLEEAAVYLLTTEKGKVVKDSLDRESK
jgi:hypothetical protein